MRQPHDFNRDAFLAKQHRECPVEESVRNSLTDVETGNEGEDGCCAVSVKSRLSRRRISGWGDASGFGSGVSLYLAKRFPSQDQNFARMTIPTVRGSPCRPTNP